MGPRHGPAHIPRRRYWNCGRPGWYFVAFCTFLRRPSLTTQDGGLRYLTREGEITLAVWQSLPRWFTGLALGPIAIMQDHVHALIRMPGMSDDNGEWRTQHGCVPMMAEPAMVLGKVVRRWKAHVTWQIRRTEDPLFRWQSRYHESMVKNRRHYRAVARYIQGQSIQSGHETGG